MNNLLIKKLQLKEEYSVLLLNSNPNVHPLFDGIRIELSEASEGQYDSVILFTKNEDELRNWIPKASAKSKKDGQIWLSYPKKSSTINSDLDRDVTWNTLKAFGMEPVRLISMNEEWSSMRVVKKENRKKASKLGEDPPGVDRKTKTVLPPKILHEAFMINPQAKIFFESLAFSHKREYVAWILGAKKEETKQTRVQKTIKLLLDGKKAK